MGGTVPRLEPAKTWPVYQKLSAAIQAGLVAACHDCSEGGIGVALAEMCFGGGWGARVDLRALSRDAALRSEGRTDKALFSESNGRFLVEVAPRVRSAFLSAMDGSPLALLGRVQKAPRLALTGLDGKRHGWSVAALEKAWRGGLKP